MQVSNSFLDEMFNACLVNHIFHCVVHLVSY